MNNFKPSSLKRLIKYWTYGYTPSDELLQSLIDNGEIEWIFDNSEGSYHEL